MGETRADVWRRIKSEGKWKEASAYRKERKEYYQKQGRGTKAATELAWKDVVRMYPPPGGKGEILEETSEEARRIRIIGETMATKQCAKKGDTTLLEDIDFARRHQHQIKDPYDYRTWKIMPNAAPSASAWNMLIYAVEDRREFLKTCLAIDKERRDQDFKIRMAKLKMGEDQDSDGKPAPDRMTKMYDELVEEIKRQAIEEAKGNGRLSD